MRIAPRPKAPSRRALVGVCIVWCVHHGSMRSDAQLRPTTQPSVSTRLPRHAKLSEVLRWAEKIYEQARVRRADPRLRPIERLAAGAHASGELARLRGQRVWFDAAPRALVPRGRVQFSPPASASAPAAASQAAPVVLDLTDIVMTPKSGHLVIVQMPARRAASIKPGTAQYFSGRIARLRRIAPGRWEVWVRHSRVPRRVDGWPHTFPDYTAYGKPTTAPAHP